jgi:hypothetical protein
MSALELYFAPAPPVAAAAARERIRLDTYKG